MGVAKWSPKQSESARHDALDDAMRRAEHSVLILHAVGHPSVGNRLAGKVGMIVVVVAMH